MMARCGSRTPASDCRRVETQIQGETGGRWSLPPSEASAAVGVEGKVAGREIDGGGRARVAASLRCEVGAKSVGEERRCGGLECGFCRPRRGNGGAGSGWARQSLVTGHEGHGGGIRYWKGRGNGRESGEAEQVLH